MRPAIGDERATSAFLSEADVYEYSPQRLVTAPGRRLRSSPRLRRAHRPAPACPAPVSGRCRDSVIVERKGGQVVFRSRFLDFPGVFMLHCHMMNHEEMGMMQTVEVYKP